MHLDGLGSDEVFTREKEEMMPVSFAPLLSRAFSLFLSQTSTFVMTHDVFLIEEPKESERGPVNVQHG